jgi:hypothetical protein
VPGESLLRPVCEIENVWIPLSDGTRLAARIWMPDDAEIDPVPALLEYTPYRKDDATAAEDAGRHPYLAARGYASARVDVRGAGDSDGLLLDEYLEQEQRDALEVISWLAEQSWCSGNVGMFGYSGGGLTALRVAALRPPALKAIITLCSTDDRYTDGGHYMGGCLLGSEMLKWATTMLAYNARPPDPRFVGDRWRDMWMERLEDTPSFAEQWLAHQTLDDYWRGGSVREDHVAIDIPVFVVDGWADPYTDAALRLVSVLDVPRKALIGPWSHDYPQRAVPGPRIGFLQEAVRWWDEELKGVDCGIASDPLLRAWVQDAAVPATYVAERPGRWVSEPSWPTDEVLPMTLTLGTDGTLTEGLAHAGLQGEHRTVSTSLTCGEAAGVWCPRGLPDELPCDQGDDDRLSMCFETSPMTEAVDLLGVPLANLSLAADQELALVAVRLTDVLPSGESSLISWGMLNLTHREGHDRVLPLVPGTRYDVTVPLLALGHRLEVGHRLRLGISPSYWPHAWPSPSPVTLTVFTDGASRASLPARTPRDDDAALPEFGTPRESTALDAEIPESSGRMRKRGCDVTTGATVIEDREVYRATLPVTGTEYHHTALDRWSIAEGDPLSAIAHARREESLKRGGWDVSVKATGELTADATDFHLNATLTALQDGKVVFTRTWETDIPRNGV